MGQSDQTNQRQAIPFQGHCVARRRAAAYWNDLVHGEARRRALADRIRQALADRLGQARALADRLG